jgi:hypothetical protein
MFRTQLKQYYYEKISIAGSFSFLYHYSDYMHICKLSSKTETDEYLGKDGNYRERVFSVREGYKIAG